jgi:hypothetical protein
MMMARNTERYGECYWCIKSQLSESGEIYMHADRVEINSHGDLRMVSDLDGPGTGNIETVVRLALSAGHWACVFAASVMDGSAVAVDHWKGEIVEEGERR